MTPKQITSLALSTRAHIEKAARQVHALVTARIERPAGETLQQWRRRVADADAEQARASAALSDMIVRPVLPQLDAKRIVVVSEGTLQYVPFGALPMPGSREGLPLLSAYEVASAPSVSSLTELRRVAAARQTATRTLAVLADPVFTADDPRVLRAATQSTSASASGDDPTRVSVRDLERASADIRSLEGPIRLERLPFSRREADAILKYIGQPRKA